jgi:hypothetical protein
MIKHSIRFAFCLHLFTLTYHKSFSASSSHLSLTLPTFPLTSGLLIKIPCLNHSNHLPKCSNLLLVSAIGLGILYTSSSSWLVFRLSWMIFQTVMFWAVAPCGLEGGYRHFGGTYTLHLQGQTYIFQHWRHVLPKMWYPPISLHGVTIQNTASSLQRTKGYSVQGNDRCLSYKTQIHCMCKMGSFNVTAGDYIE